MTGAEELLLAEDEASELARGISDVKRHYPSVDLLGEKGEDWVGLIMVAVAVYGPRMRAIRDRRRMARENAAGMGHNGGPPLDPTQPVTVPEYVNGAGRPASGATEVDMGGIVVTQVLPEAGRA